MVLEIDAVTACELLRESALSITIDYLAEHRGRPSAAVDGKTHHRFVGACHASRIVDGGVDSQA